MSIIQHCAERGGAAIRLCHMLLACDVWVALMASGVWLAGCTGTRHWWRQNEERNIWHHPAAAGDIAARLRRLVCVLVCVDDSCTEKRELQCGVFVNGRTGGRDLLEAWPGGIHCLGWRGLWS